MLVSMFGSFVANSGSNLWIIVAKYDTNHDFLLLKVSNKLLTLVAKYRNKLLIITN